MGQQFYKTIIEKSNIGYIYQRVIYDAAGRPCDFEIIEANPFIGKISGFSVAEIIGKRYSELAPDMTPEERKTVMLMAEVAQHGGTREIEQYYPTLKHTYNIKVFSPVQDHVVLFVDDTSKIESMLMESEAKYKLIANNMADIIWILDFSDFHITYISPSIEKVLGYKVEDMYRMSLKDIMTPLSFAQVMRLFKEELQHEKNKLDPERVRTVEINQIHKDGSIIPIEHTFRFLRDPDRNILQMIGLGRDVTIQNQALEQLQESERSKSVLLSNLPGMAYRCNFDRNWTMQFVSDGCYELTGYRPESLLYNRDISFNEIISREYREYLWETWNRALSLKLPVREEYTIVTATGKVKWVLEQGQGIFNDHGEIEALEGLIIDITDQKEKQEEILYLSYHDGLTGLYNRIYFDEEKKRLDNEAHLPLTIMIGDINGLKMLNDAFGHAEGDRLIIETAQVIQSCCGEAAVVARTGGDEFTILFPNTSSDNAYKILKSIQRACEDHNSYTFNDAYHINISLGYATKEKTDDDFDRIQKLAEDYMYKHKLLDRNSSHSALLSSIKSTMFAKSQETEEHAERLQRLARLLGLRLNLSDNELDELSLLATLHDIGKVGISDKILKKPGKLNDEEWAEMKKHPEIGYRIAMATPELMSIANYILCHHERWDGYGYPQGLRGDSIPLLSRIISVVDTYDAMTQDRPYRKALTKAAALAEIQDCTGSQFDPKVATAFLEMFINVDEYQEELLAG